MSEQTSHHTDSSTTDQLNEAVVARADDELSPEELEEVSGGNAAGKRNAFNSSQQSWQATID